MAAAMGRVLGEKLHRGEEAGLGRSHLRRAQFHVIKLKDR